MPANQGLGDPPLRGALLGTGPISIHHMRAWESAASGKAVALSAIE